MPIFDFPLAKLKEYKGINPRPKDFDEYWDRALAEMRALDPDVKLVPHPLGASFADCFDMYFAGVGGARVHAQLLRPKSAPPVDPAALSAAPKAAKRVAAAKAEPRKGAAGGAPGLVMFHGYSGNAGDWSTKLGYAAQGFTVAALDCRGQGGQSQDVGGVAGNTLRGHIIRGLDDAPDKLLFRQIYLDCAQLAGLVMRMPGVDPGRVGATGGSQGGGLTLACAALEPGVKLAAPVFPFLCDYRRVWEMDLAKNAYEELRGFFRLFDPLHQREEEIWTRLGYIDCQHLAPRIKARLQMHTGLMDDICPPSTQFAAYNRMTCEREMVIYPDFAHEGLPGQADRVFQFMSGL
jgi:cephalosporin-C deacetylase